MANFKAGSRYTNGTFTLDVNKNKFLLLRSKLSVDPSGQDTYFTIQSHHINRIDLISQEMYNRSDLGWVIMDINNIKQPLIDLQVGQELRIPPLALVLQAIEHLNQTE
jgi:hypothetical protein